MSKQQTIALDAMGGDFGPSVVVPGAGLALTENPSLRFLFYGDEKLIRPLLAQNAALQAVSTVFHTDKIIASDEKPSAALRAGRDSSMRLAIEAVKNGEAGSIVSAGNTGALMAMAKMSLRCLPGINRPAIASVLPTEKEDIIMLDLGANVHCDAEILVQFAVLGAVYARVIRGLGSPTVGLLNIGSEEMKGNDQVRAAAAILSQVALPGRFVGFIEGNDIPKGKVDVAVTDGFTGNVALKVAEGVSDLMSHFMRQAFASSFLAKIGGMLAYGALKKLKKRMDPRFYNGGMFLGLNGICVKSHGGMDSYAFSRAVLMAARLVENDYNNRVAVELEHLMNQESFVTELAAQVAGVPT